MLFDLFHVLLKPKIIKHPQYPYKAYSCGAYPYLKAMALVERKLNTAKVKPVAERVPESS